MSYYEQNRRCFLSVSTFNVINCAFHFIEVTLTKRNSLQLPIFYKPTNFLLSNILTLASIILKSCNRGKTEQQRKTPLQCYYAIPDNSFTLKLDNNSNPTQPI